MTEIFTKTNLLAKTYGYSRSGYSSGLGLSWLIWSFFYIGFYVYLAICLMLVAKKTATSGGWMAWIPFLNLYLMCKAAGKSGLWIVLLLLPFINIVAIVLLWAAIAERLGRPAWWGILMLVPLANVIIMGILAFSKGPQAVAPKTASPARPKKITGGLICSECGAQAEASDKFCPDCGAKIKTAGSFCPGCGSNIKSADKFCPGCGAKLT